MADITSLVSAIGGISALIGMGTASVNQLGTVKRQWQTPQQQVQQAQRCPLAPDGRPMQGQFRTLPDGTYQFVCVEDQR
jgi:hypothetical protein